MISSNHHNRETRERRKGAKSRTQIPPGILAELNQGRLQTANLVEWLAVDMAKLLQSVLPEIGLSRRDLDGIDISGIRTLGVTKRLEVIGATLFREIQGNPRRETILEAIASHRSDIVRQWGAYIVAANPELDLAGRLSQIRRFAADINMSVRECAWMVVRPHLTANVLRGIQLLRDWVRDGNPNIRRFAIELTRPRGVWCTHIPFLKSDPQRGLILLEPVRADQSRYVQRSVANWLNDASKTRPEWVHRVCRRWMRTRVPETVWIVNRALRTVGRRFD